MLCVMAFECSLHGLVRGENMELGRDSDTGGQVGFSPCLGSSSILKKKNCPVPVLAPLKEILNPKSHQFRLFQTP
jgi:hypothetical protein